MHTAAYKVDVASDRRRRENVPKHILCFSYAVSRENTMRITGLKKKLISLIVAVIMTVSGMYVENINIDSSFAYEDTANQNFTPQTVGEKQRFGRSSIITGSSIA